MCEICKYYLRILAPLFNAIMWPLKCSHNILHKNRHTTCNTYGGMAHEKFCEKVGLQSGWASIARHFTWLLLSATCPARDSSAFHHLPGIILLFETCTTAPSDWTEACFFGVLFLFNLRTRAVCCWKVIYSPGRPLEGMVGRDRWLEKSDCRSKN